MLKVILMLDCNICGQPFDHVCISTDRDPQTWKGMSQDLEYKAEHAGWSFTRAAHHCDYCVSDAMLCKSEDYGITLPAAKKTDEGNEEQCDL